jgi:CheY-like chemotaxis protein
MIIEDDLDTIEIARVILELHGYEVTGIDDSQAALDRLALEKPDVIIMDLSIRPINGWDLMKEIRSRGFTSLPLIAFSGFSGNIQEIFKSGFNGYIPKPCSPDKIVAEVKRFLP